jgi:multidrug efflux pump subunit AcrB
MRSLALEGRCLVRLDLKEGADLDAVRKDVEARLVDIKNLVPQRIGRVSYDVLPSTDAFTIVALMAAGEQSPEQLKELARQTLQPRLLRIAGIHTLVILGAAEPLWEVVISPESLAKFGLSVADVTAAVRTAAGQPKKDREALEDTVVMARENARPTLLKDVATVRRTLRNTEEVGIVRRAIPGSDRAVLLLIQFAAANEKGVRKGIDEAVAEWKAKLPAEVRVESGFFGPTDLAASLRLPAGASEAQRSRFAREAAEAAVGTGWLDDVVWIVSAAGDEIRLLPRAVKAAPQNKPRPALRAALGKIPGVAVRVGRAHWPLDLWPGEGEDVAVRVSGEDAGRIRGVADQVRERLAAVAGVVDCSVPSAPDQQLIFDIDRVKLARLGISVEKVVDTIAMVPDNPVIEPVGETRYSITILKREFLTTEDMLKQLKIRNAQGEMVALADVVKFRTEPSGATYRENGRPCVVVSANVERRTKAAVLRDVEGIAKEFSRDGVSVEY